MVVIMIATLSVSNEIASIDGAKQLSIKTGTRIE